MIACSAHSTVDGLSEPDGTAMIYDRKYPDLYTSVGFNQTDTVSVEIDDDRQIGLNASFTPSRFIVTVSSYYSNAAPNPC